MIKEALKRQEFLVKPSDGTAPRQNQTADYYYCKKASRKKTCYDFDNQYSWRISREKNTEAGYIYHRQLANE